MELNASAAKAQAKWEKSTSEATSEGLTVRWHAASARAQAEWETAVRMSEREANRETAHFGQATGNQHGFRVLAHVQGRCQAGNNGVDILECAGQFHAVDINIGVNPKVFAAQQFLHCAAHIRVFSGYACL